MERSPLWVMDTEHSINSSDTGPDDVPPNVIAEAKAAFNARARAGLAALVWDSLIDEDAPGWHHHLRFEHPRMWIEVSVAVNSGWSSLHGVMHPAAPAGVELELDGVESSIKADVTRSAFRIERFPRGLVRLRLVGLTSHPVIYTDWFHV
jgi:hypothetical protein